MAIYVTEVARKYGDAWIENDLRQFNEDANPLLYRIAFKMATFETPASSATAAMFKSRFDAIDSLQSGYRTLTYSGHMEARRFVLESADGGVLLMFGQSVV